MTQLRVSHPSELFFGMLGRGAVAGAVMTVLYTVFMIFMSQLRTREQLESVAALSPLADALFTIIAGLPIGIVFGLLTAAVAYAVLRLWHRRWSLPPTRFPIVAAVSSAVLCLVPNLWMSLAIGDTLASFIVAALVLNAATWVIATVATTHAIRITERRLNAGRP
ncbi:hypothetical protein [Glutamicibacter sp. NPDC087344]|uniref:hypothetical protein n=1 Tax=Glutamicibacter sp. NPDC087344 TaxID=3363994 RepID=UPI00382AF1AD